MQIKQVELHGMVITLTPKGYLYPTCLCGWVGHAGRQTPESASVDWVAHLDALEGNDDE